MDDIDVVSVDRISINVDEPSEAGLLETGRRIVKAFRSTGFAYIKQHGIADSTQAEAFSVSRRFFDLKLSLKMQYERFVAKGLNGYTPVGGENTGYANSDTAGVDLKECFNLHYLGLDYPEREVAGFGEACERLADACRRLSLRLLASIDAALGTDGLLVKTHQLFLKEGSGCMLRLLNYPAVTPDCGQPLVADATRCGAHADYGSITLLFNDGSSGLEVAVGGETSNRWMPAPPKPGAILVNIGAMMEIWTSGALKATLHRVVVPAEEALKRRSRQSLVFFVQPDDHVIVSPIDGDTSKYKPVNSKQFVIDKYTSTQSAASGWFTKN